MNISLQSLFSDLKECSNSVSHIKITKKTYHKEHITDHKENGRFTSTNQSNSNLMNTRAVVHAGEGRSPVDACAPPPTRRPHTPSSSTPAVSSCVGPAGRGALDTASQVSTRQLHSYL